MLDVVALAPVIGDLKYLDEVATGVKSIFKNSDEVIDGGRHVARVADALGDISKKGGTALDGMADSLRATAIKNMKNADILNDAKYVDDVANAASDVGKRLDDLANVASDAGKKLDDLAGGGAGGKFQEVFDLADDYTLSDNTFNNHILDRHGSNSTYKNKSHFNEDFDIREGIDSTLKGDNFVVGPNTAGREGYIFEQTFTNPIGINSKGKLLYTLKVVIDENGNVITAFPKN